VGLRGLLGSLAPLVAALPCGEGLPPDLDARCTFELVRSPETFVRVRIEARGAKEGTTSFSISERWGGVEHFEKGIRALEVRDASGKALPAERPAPHRWSVRHPPGAPLEVVYELAPTGERIGDERESRYRPAVLPDLFHLVGTTGLVVPDPLEGEEPRSIEIRWVGFSEAGWKVVSSFGAGPEPRRIRRPLHEFVYGLYVAGDLRVVPVPLRGGTLHVAIAGEDWGFSDDLYVDLVRRIVVAERDFFDDHGDPHFLVSLVPVGVRNPRSRSLGGTGLTDSFALFLLPGTGIEEEAEMGRGLRWLLAHELFHNWNGQKMPRLEPEALVYWFSEGFTDFYARRLLLRAGLITLEEYAADLSERVGAYLASPVRNEPNERILRDYWKDERVERLPYLRGEVVALLLDAAIRKASGGVRSLDELMRDLLARGRRGERVSTERLLALAESYAGKECAERLRRIVVEGGTPEIPTDLLAPCLEGETVERASYEPGFDIQASLAAKVITGVIAESPAFREGLRDGQPLRRWSVHRGRVDRPIELTIEEEGKERRLSFFPEGKPVSVPRFRARAGAGEECRARL
jgi:predicted metalloprotease with PDZ domain